MYKFLCIVLSLLLSACGGGGGDDGQVKVDVIEKPEVVEPEVVEPELDSDEDGVPDSQDVDIDNDQLIEISSLEQLDWVRHDLKGTSRHDGSVGDSLGCPVEGCRGYELINDLDFDTDGDGSVEDEAFFDYDGDGSDNGWLPIGSSDLAFDAEFNGNNHTIFNLYIDRSSFDAETGGRNIGLFGAISYSGWNDAIGIKNLRLRGGSVIGHYLVGSLVGYAAGFQQITSGVDVHLSNIETNVDVSAFQNVGGLAGNSDFSYVSNVRTSGVISGVSFVGGLFGDLETSTVLNSEATGEVSGSFTVGGLIGNGKIINVESSTASGNVSAVSRDVGGLIGILSTRSEVVASSATGAVSGTNNVGGLIGRIETGSEVVTSGATGAVRGSNAVGGLIGRANKNVSNNSYPAFDQVKLSGNYAVGRVVATGNYVGGLVGISYNTEMVANFTTSPTTGKQYVGGFIGDANKESVIKGSYSAGTVSGNDDVGGFVGWNDGGVYEYNLYVKDKNIPAGYLDIGNDPSNQGPHYASNIDGYTLEQMQCPKSEADADCTVFLYINWSSYTDENNDPFWDFGSDTQLPGLYQNGEIARDGDADGQLDN